MCVGEILNKFQKDKVRFRLTSIGSVPSLPLLVKKQGKIYLCLIFYGTGTKTKKGNIKIFHPNSHFELSMTSARIVKYTNLAEYVSANKLSKHIGEFPHKSIENMNLMEYLKEKSEIIMEYDKAVQLFHDDNRDEEFLKNFRLKFYKLTHPCLVPYLVKNAEGFFKWME